MNAETLKDLLDDPEAHDGLNDGILFAELAGMPKVMMDTEHARLLYDRAALAPQLAADNIALQAEVERLREAITILIDSEAGEVDRRLALKDARAALKT